MSSNFCGKFLQELKKAGWKQKDIAALLDVTPTQAHRLFHDSPPSIQVVLKLADHFNVSTDRVLGRE